MYTCAKNQAPTGRMPEWLWGWLQELYDFLATLWQTPPVYPGFESQFDQNECTPRRDFCLFFLATTNADL